MKMRELEVARLLSPAAVVLIDIALRVDTPKRARQPDFLESALGVRPLPGGVGAGIG